MPKTTGPQDSLSIHRKNRLILNSVESNHSSSTIENRSNSSRSERSSSLKKTTQSSRIKSPKSVTFSLDENLSNHEKVIDQFDQITTPIISSFSPCLSKENQMEILPNFGK